MVNITQLRQLIAKHNKAFKVMGVWKMKREELLKVISDNGLLIKEHSSFLNFKQHEKFLKSK